MARTKAGQLARKFVGIGGDSSSDADEVEAPAEARADEAGDVTVEAAESKRSDIYTVGRTPLELCIYSKGRKRKKHAPTYEELLDRLEKKRENDRIGAKK